MNPLHWTSLAIWVAATLPLPAYAEVMDKEPSLLMVWTMGAIGGALGFLLARRHSKWALATLLLPLFFYASLLSEIHDPFVGPAIRGESGLAYVASSYLAPFLLILVHIVGWLMLPLKNSVDVSE